ncbi:Eco57I restriction-modification methylase domain-containing protein [Prevotella merdae]|uniref:Eco57I restriction-modification methylase domain-containing protein n=1 Tax=Prevotella merdae TaxID=2079531 RepID=UPI000D1005A0|nr:Eco57I restriction-modification methylase domain-containing protein [Prevotella merdae]
MKYTITQSRLLYLLSQGDRKHQGLLKIGEVFVDNDIADSHSSQELGKAVRAVLDARSYMQGVSYHIEYVECTTYDQDSKCYKADDVYRTLRAMDIPSKTLGKYKDPTTGQTEDADIWFACTIFDIQDVISKIKQGKGAGHGAIKFRPEQEKAIHDTVEYFQKEFKDPNKGKHYLWNAKMRFGKTLSGLEVAKRCGYRSTLIITHRPVVDKGWHDDFAKIFRTPEALADYHAKGLEPAYGRRMMDDNDSQGDFYTLTREVDAGKKILVFFVSMQYLRLSQFVGGKERNFDPLKRAIMEYDWDFVMVDEAHEGIDAAAGVRVMNKLKKENTRILSLSGTPFNLLDKYEESEIYTWDYVMEQRAKQFWDEHHYGDPNPYADLPRMQILTFTLPKMLRDQAIENNEVFKFHEFFRVYTEEDKLRLQKLIDNEPNAIKKAEYQEKLSEVEIDKFVHEKAINRFLDKLVEESDTSLYPFSTENFREHFRHTFWLLPGVKEAAALEQLLRKHEVFSEIFHIINAAGDGNIEDKNGSALADVLDNIRGNAKKNITKKDYTITLSCGKLTTGVSVPEWTAVLCMKGSENTPAANYMQTIFRVQTHAVLEGRQKSDCYVFDFAPDRALTAVAETAKMAVYAQTEKGKKQMKLTQKKEEEHLAAFIKLCPVLSMDEGEMGKHFSANQIFEKLSNVYIERAVRSGYADNSLYNPDQLMNLSPEQEKALGDVHDLLGSMPNAWKPEKINVNNNGLSNSDADHTKYIYYLSASEALPARPSMAAEFDENGKPTTHDDGWDDVMCAPSELFPYLYISHSQLLEGEWCLFSNPVLWKKWENKDKDDKTDEAKKKRDEENKEKRARMSVLRGVAIRIPLLVYGAEINDEVGEEITIDNFASEEIVDQASWEEFMPKGFTKQTFNTLKDCFDRSIFTGAAKRIRQMVKEADNLNTEDRIAKIATIFSYFHNPDKETVLTPWRVVNMHMSDTVGGWCFWDEDFVAPYTEENQYGENVNAARFVDRGDVTKDVFTDYNSRILEINSKTGLYPLYMAYSLFKGAKEPNYRKVHLTGERGKSLNAEQYYHQAGDDLEIWKDVLQDNIFVVCRTKMAVSITKRTLAGFRTDIRMNIRCYEHDVPVTDLVSAGVLKAADEHVTKEGKTYFFNGHESLNCDMINVLRAKPELFQNDIVRGKDFWHVYNSIPKSENEDINNMKFKAIVGNPPYQIEGESTRKTPIYNLFYDTAFELSPLVTFITPGRFLFKAGQTPMEWMEKMLSDTHFKVVDYFQKSSDVFPTVDIKGGVAIGLRNANKEFGAIGFFSDYPELKSIMAKVFANPSFQFGQFASLVSSQGIYRFSEKALSEFPRIYEVQGKGTASKITSNAFENLSEIFVNTEKECKGEGVQIIGRIKGSRETKWVNASYLQPCEYLNYYNVLVPEANGTGAIGEVLSTPVIGVPVIGHTDTFLSIGKFADAQEASACLNYVKTKFARCLLGTLKATQHNPRDTWANVPLQNFTAISDIDWTQSIADIDKQLYRKYKLDEDEIEFIEKMIKPME